MGMIPQGPILAVLSILGLVVAQEVHNVTVGDSGSFFVPDTVSARAGDIVRFTFSKAPHGIVQSSFEKPCVPLPGGFSSGMVVNGATTESTWDLQITNESGECDNKLIISLAKQPLVLLFNTGMVGAINPPSFSMMDDYKTRAKMFPQNSAPSVSTVLSGIGAVASVPPATPSTIFDPSNIPSDSSTSSISPKTESPVAPTNPPASSSSSHHTAAIVGGAVAGVVALLATIIIIVILLRKRPQRQVGPLQHETVETHYFPAPNSPPNSGKAESFATATGHTPPALYPTRRQEEGFPSVGHAYSSHPGQSSTSSNARGLPQGAMHVRNQSSLGELPPGMGHVPSVERLRGHPYAFAGNSGDTENGEDSRRSEAEARSENISSLAKEVAAVLMKEQNQNRRADGNDSGKKRTRFGRESPGDPPPDYKSRGHGG
ncbi:hypothetical protein PQX77_018030 [Marasmius sp. AFHP31]|nr:hypothetical protein PQX77_018030 [Marasmius sp. AFHP31]